VDLLGHQPLSPVKAGRRMEHLKLDQVRAQTAGACWTRTAASGGVLSIKDRFGRHV